MSSIRSNSLGEAELQDFEQTDPKAKALECLLSIPLNIPQQAVHLVIQQDQAGEKYKNIYRKAEMFIKCLLSDIRYKNQLKKLSLNASQFDRVKTICGMKSFQKDIVKFSILLKHHDAIESKNYLAHILTKMLLGEQFFPQQDQ